MNKITLGIVAAVFSTSVNASWSIVDLTHNNGNALFPTEINDLGQITGSYYDNNVSHSRAFITSSNGLNGRDIAPFEKSTNSVGTDINNLGKVVGNTVIFEPFKSSELNSFITDASGEVMKKLQIDTKGDSVGFAIATSINDSGQLTGSYLSKEHKGIISFIADEDGGNLRNIGTLAGSSATRPIEINNSGQIVGNSKNGREDFYIGERAFITNEDGYGIRDLGTLDNSIYKSSIAADINESGQVVGSSYTDYYRHSHAFITGEDGEGMIHMGVLKGYAYSHAVAINDAGQAVGMSTNGWGMNSESFIYTNGALTSLMSIPEVVNAGWSDIFVTDINNNGQIIGWGYLEGDPFKQEHSFLLSFTADTVFTPSDFYIPPVPEPSTYLIMLAGLGLLGFVGRRKIQFS